jgi:hypothetical protein
MRKQELGVASIFLRSKLCRTDELPDWHAAGCVIIDPSGKSKKSDDTVLGVMLMYDEKPVLRELKLGKLTPQDTVRESITLALRYGLRAIVVEGVAYQSSLKYWIEFFLREARHRRHGSLAHLPWRKEQER